MSKPAQSEIAKRAHQIWEREGRPHGRDQDHWHNAEREILGAATAADDQPIGEIRSAVQAAEGQPASSSQRSTDATGRPAKPAANRGGQRATPSGTPQPRDKSSTAGPGSPQVQAGQPAAGSAQQSATGNAQPDPAKSRKPRAGSSGQP